MGAGAGEETGIEPEDAQRSADALAAWAALPAPPHPVARYVPFVRFGDLVALSAISTARDGALVTGKLGRDLDLNAGRAAARRAADNLLAILLAAAGGDPDRIERILMLRGYVNAAEDFGEVHKVIDGASERIVEMLGEERGAHARTALGLATLPNRNAVTLEAIARLKPSA
jgi:enamine deaminase RidA (YjgF/YER057c/UK114 family)